MTGSINDKQISEAIKSAEALASAGMDAAQQKIDFIQIQRRDLLLNNISEMRKWQSWLATISFSLAAAIAPILLLASPNRQHSPYLIAGFLLLLANGALISLRVKTMLELESAELLTLGADTELQQLEKKRAALMWYHDVKNQVKYKNYIKAEQSIHEPAIVERPKKQRVDYTNDVGVGLLVYAIYLMAHELIINHRLYSWGLVLIPILFAIVAIRSGKRSEKANEKFSHYLSENRRHSKEWSDFIDNQHKG